MYQRHLWIIECHTGEEWAFVNYEFVREDARIRCKFYRRQYPGVKFHIRKYTP